MFMNDYFPSKKNNSAGLDKVLEDNPVSYTWIMNGKWGMLNEQNRYELRNQFHFWILLFHFWSQKWTVPQILPIETQWIANII